LLTLYFQRRSHTFFVRRTQRTQRIRTSMKYMLTWSERSQGSAIEYENAQKRILEVFRQWKAPANFKIELFVIRVGDWGGYMMLDCDDPTAVHKFCSMLPAFVFEARPVIPIEYAVRVELESIAFRDGLKASNTTKA
jgi:muconolactone delta-isomerase